MGIYSRTERIETVKFGNADMVCMMQDNHILALGKKYWAVKLSDYSWTKYQRDIEPFIYTSGIPINYMPNTKVYCCNGATTIDISGTTQTRIYFPNYTDLDKVDLDCWLVYEFNQTLYAKVDLGTLSYSLTQSAGRNLFGAIVNNLKITEDNNATIKAFSFIYSAVSIQSSWVDKNMSYAAVNSQRIILVNNDYDSVESFTRGMKGKTLLYEVAE